MCPVIYWKRSTDFHRATSGILSETEKAMFECQEAQSSRKRGEIIIRPSLTFILLHAAQNLNSTISVDCNVYIIIVIIASVFTVQQFHIVLDGGGDKLD